MKAVIIAAGMGNRLWEKTDKRPKTLLPYNGGTILSTIIENLIEAGIDEILMVVGYKRAHIEDYLNSKNFDGCKISFIINDEWEKGNGISVHLTRSETSGEPFILSMADHIVPVSALKRIIESRKSANLLLVDPKVETIFDIDDATKVKLENDDIIDIGKEISDYNHIDCGVFRFTERFYLAMERALKAGQESISAAVNQLIASNDMKGVLLEEHETWIDIDTPEAYKHAVEKLNEQAKQTD